MLKSLFVAASVLTVLAPSVEALEFVNADGSKFSQLCIAAAQSKEALKREAHEMNITTSQISNIQCNGMNINDFANEYSDNSASRSIRVYAFENTNNTPESELCIAAATSNETFEQTKARLFDKQTIRNVSCNGVKLAKFARQFNSSFNG